MTSAAAAQQRSQNRNGNRNGPRNGSRNGGRRAEIRETNEVTILQAAEEVFAEYGFHGATTAMIAERAGLPKANVHYYFGTKEALYKAALENTLSLWLSAVDSFTPDADPAEALAAYIRAKIEYSRSRPLASRIFANEIIAGAPQIKGYLDTTLRQIVADKGKVIESWVAAGKMAPVDPLHLFIMLWATTQTYADFAVQAAAIMGKDQLDDGDYDRAAAFVTGIVLKGCGLTSPQ